MYFSVPIKGVGNVARKQFTRRQFSLSSSVKWFGIPVSLGVTCLALLQLRRTVKKERGNPASPQPLTWQLMAFSQLPTRLLSRSWGQIMSKEIPFWLRRPLLGAYVWLYSCNMAEAEDPDLSHYTSFTELFTRRLRSGSRTVDDAHHLVSPVDGKILNFGTVDGSIIEQVKGVHYSLDAFLGSHQSEEEYMIAAKQSHDGDTKKLHHIIVYLAPGDCHHFYSPADWRVSLCRHLPGELLTVAPWAAHKMPGLFALNERVVLAGDWKHGHFTYTAVGAFNVGSISLSLERTKELQTNKKGRYLFGEYFDTVLRAGEDTDQGIAMKRGDHMGMFNLGSTLVLLFEAPSDFQFVVKQGQSVKRGQPLGTVTSDARSG